MRVACVCLCSEMVSLLVLSHEVLKIAGGTRVQCIASQQQQRLRSQLVWSVNVNQWQETWREWIALQ